MDEVVKAQLAYSRRQLVFYLAKLRMKQLAGHDTKFAAGKVKEYTEEIEAYEKMLGNQVAIILL